MEQRLSYFDIGQAPLKALLSVEAAITRSGLDLQLLHLVKMRVSQMNGCAYCLDMHSKDLRAGGESEQRIYLLDAWRESTFFSPRERAALAWAEAVTNVTDGHVPDAVYDTARAEFSEVDLVNLTMAVVTINAWNRLNVAFRMPAGSYQPPK
ncbi:MAG TPA: carboxymuconolactone decarboxylase family protein [Candidatus Binatia bacterium]|jgi:AhpD family alkylhydroperoxidase|nr:carboxymuconolactone decarboxylase family protein [Candidatus Binatia bacterium]